METLGNIWFIILPISVVLAEHFTLKLKEAKAHD